MACNGSTGGTVSDGKNTTSGILAMPLKQSWPLFSLWTMHVWIYWFNTTPLRPSGVAPTWAGIYGAMAIVLLAVAFAFRTKKDLARIGRFDIPMTVTMCACTASVLLAFVLARGSATWAALNVALAGACMGWGYLRWSAPYADMGIRNAVACLFGSYLAGSTIKIAFDAAPGWLGFCLAFALPIVSLVSLRLCAKLELPQNEAQRGEVLYSGMPALQSLWRVALCVFVFCLVRQVASLTTTSNEFALTGRLVGHFVEVAFALAALAWVFRLNRALDFPQLWRFVFLFLASTIAADCLFEPSLMPRLCDGVAISLIVMLLWLVLADIAHHSDHHPYLIFGLGWGLYVSANYLGLVLVRLVAGGATMTAELGVALLWATGVVMAFCLETRDPDVQRLFADLRTKVDPEEFASIDERCEQLGQQYGLTGREIDVLKLLAKGRSKIYIAETLYISENTVRGHSRRLYTKLGVHTRDELQAMLGI